MGEAGWEMPRRQAEWKKPGEEAAGGMVVGLPSGVIRHQDVGESVHRT